MNDNDAPSRTTPRRGRPAWNKGKVPGPKPPLRTGHVWAIRAKLQIEKRTRDLAMFTLAIDSKLRGCDLVALRVDDVAPNGYAIDGATVRQSPRDCCRNCCAAESFCPVPKAGEHLQHRPCRGPLLLDDLVGAGEQVSRDRNAQTSCRCEIDRSLSMCR